jgi:Mrp family chromosome partitioning ATPase
MRPEPRAFSRYYRTLVEHWWVIVLCVVVAVGAAGAYVATAHKQYTAQAQMLVAAVPITDSNLLGLPLLHGSGDATTDMLTAASLISNSQVAARVVRTLHLNQTPTELLSNIQATPLGQSGLLAVQASASSAASAQAIANEYVRQVVATRAAALHAAVAAALPALKAQNAASPPGQRGAPGTASQQYSQYQALEKINDPTITIATLADRPTAPSSPQTKITLAAALAGGLILGLLAAFAFDLLDPRLRRDEQVKEIFDVPIVARIPRQRRTKSGRPILPEELSFGGAEGYRTLRTIVSARASGEPRSVLVTSSTPAEGKTTSAINLAVALAHGRSGVILVEADLRRPSIADALRLDVRFGIDDVLTGEADIGEALTTAEVGGAVVGVLALRRPGADLADMLSLSVAESLINQLKALSDFVVIDSPPLTTVGDALPLARLADDVLVVTRYGSKVSKLWELRDLLMDEGSFPTGVVLVGQPARQTAQYYGSSAGSLRARHQEHGAPDPVA